MEIHLRFAMHRDKPLIHEEKRQIDGLVIPAHILAYQPPSTSVFVTSLPNKTYVIDPMTFIFQNPKNLHLNADGQLRPSVERLCEQYHPGLAASVMSLGSNDWLKPDKYPNIEEFCTNVVRFELDKIEAGSSESRATKYLKRYDMSKLTPPRAVIPPYFRFESVTDEWYKFSLSCAEFTKTLAKGSIVGPVILSHRAALSDEGIRRIVKDYSSFGHVFLWIDDYAEASTTADVIRKVRCLIKCLTQAGTRVETLYGGYLMIMAALDGLEAVSHGILYTEHKSIRLTPGSGGAPERYYIPAFHAFRSLSQTDLIIHRFPQLMCDCAVCSKILAGNPDNFILFGDNPELLRRHFLAVRRREANRIGSSSASEEVERLRETYGKFHKTIALLPNPDAFVTSAPMKGLDYLEEWATAFS